jgi:hypothetical protein
MIQNLTVVDACEVVTEIDSCHAEDYALGT